MSEWWTYTLSDFLMFSPRTYYRLFELHNAAIWPAQVATVLVGLAILWRLRRPEASRGRLIAALLSGCWLFVAGDFHLVGYAKINWAAVYFAAAFGLEAALLIWTGVVRGALPFERGSAASRRVGFWLFLFALLLEPSIGPLLGRSWRQVEVFGAAPDPTAVATLGVLALAAGRARWELLAVPAIWCGITGATLLAMKAPDFCVPPAAGALALWLAAVRTFRRRRALRLPAAGPPA